MKILYLMHVDWRWIKQRPHFLAEELQRAGVKVVVGYVPTTRRLRLPSNPTPLFPVPLPLSPRWAGRFSRAFNCTIGKAGLWLTALLVRPSHVWITFPSLYTALPNRLKECTVIYDAMDDSTELFDRPSERERVLADEVRALAGSTLVLATSEPLQLRLTLLDSSAKPILVPNALDGRAVWNRGLDTSIRSDSGNQRDTFNVAYVGTIADWFDFDAILEATDQLPDVRFDLYGPILTDSVPDNSCIRLRGTIPHAQIASRTANADAYVLPFRISALVEAVDPVKVYEYLAMGRPTICSYYPALDKFSEFVHFYGRDKPLSEVIRELRTDSFESTDWQLVAAFLAENTWQHRVSNILSEL